MVATDAQRRAANKYYLNNKEAHLIRCKIYYDHNKLKISLQRKARRAKKTVGVNIIKDRSEEVVQPE
jgi:hypothetical protein